MMTEINIQPLSKWLTSYQTGPDWQNALRSLQNRLLHETPQQIVDECRQQLMGNVIGKMWVRYYMTPELAVEKILEREPTEWDYEDFCYYICVMRELQEAMVSQNVTPSAMASQSATPSPAPQRPLLDPNLIPAPLNTPRAMALWQICYDQGWIDHQFHSLRSRVESAIIAKSMAQLLGLYEYWGLFEEVFGMKNLRSASGKMFESQAGWDFRALVEQHFGM